MPPERIRILHSLSSVSYGGVEQRRLVLARGLDPARYEQRLLVRAVEGDLPRKLEEAGMPLEILGSMKLFNPRALARAAGAARRFRPHVVHGAVMEGISAAVVAGRAAGARVVVEETSHATNRSPRGHALFRTFVAASHACVAVSPAVGDYLADVTRVPRGKITVIPNGVSVPVRPTEAVLAAARAELGLPDDAFVLGTVGRLLDDGHKRFSDLLRAVALLAPRHPRLRLLLVGDGPLRGEYERLVRDLGVASRVVFAGSRDDMGTLYGLMNAFALLSAREAFGLVVAEAMLCDLPVVVTRVGGMADIVTEGTGLLVPPLSPESAADAIGRLLEDPRFRSDLSRAGRERAREHFSAERYVRDVDAFYRKLLSARGTSHAPVPAV